jgi:imidazolonepropionase-like amidohydrolase
MGPSLLRVAALSALCLQEVPGQDVPIAFTGARILPIAGPELDSGTLVVHRGKIVAVGADGAVTIPAGAERTDARGKVLMPGLVDTHSHIGGGGGGDQSATLHPDARILDAINVRDPSVRKARAGGITTVNVMPGSGHLMSGQTLYLKLRAGGTVDELLIRLPDGGIAGGLKMANGTNSIRSGAPFPGTRARSAALVRALYVKAQEYRDAVQRAAGDAGKLPARDLGLEFLGEVLAGKRLVHHHTHRHDDILTALRIQKEFNLRMVLHHVSDGWKVADEIARSQVPCSIIVLDSPGGKLEALDCVPETGSVLEKAAVLTSFHTDDGITDSRLFLRSPAMAVRNGMSRKAALEGVTLAAARMLDLEDRVGSLEAGKEADFLVLSGDPLSVYTKVEQTWVEGRKVFDRADPQDRLFAEGGYGAGQPSLYLCCFAVEVQ